MDDTTFTELMAALCGADDDQTMWDAIAADAGAGVLDVTTLHDPDAGLTSGEAAAAEQWRAKEREAAPDWADLAARSERLGGALARKRHLLPAELDELFAHGGDVLMPPPTFDDVEVPGSVWSETAALEDHYREDHPFPLPIDPDEEKPW